MLEFNGRTIVDMHEMLQAIAGPTVEQQTGPFRNVLLTSLRGLDSRLLDLSVPGWEPRGAINADLMIEGSSALSRTGSLT